MGTTKIDDFMKQVLLLVRSGHPLIYIVTHEESRALDFVTRLTAVLRRENQDHLEFLGGAFPKNLLTWYSGKGLRLLNNPPIASMNAENVNTSPQGWFATPGFPENPSWGPTICANPNDALTSLCAATVGGAPTLANSITVFFDLHPYLVPDGIMVRPLRNAVDEFRAFYAQSRAAIAQTLNRTPPPASHSYKTLIVVAPTADKLSAELERDCIVLDFPLPEEDELKLHLKKMLDAGVLRIARDTSSEETPQAQLEERIANAGRGLTLEDYKLGLNGFAVRAPDLSEDHIEDMLNLKATAISNPALQYTPHVTLSLGGLNKIKDWVAIRRDAVISPSVRKAFHLPTPRGVMLCGVSGGGKSQLAKLIAKEFGLALLRLDIGALFGQYVGESEQRTREALQLAEALAPVVLWLDEVDKAFTAGGGGGVGGGNDGGVSARVFVYFLTWLAEKESSVFVVTTANDFTNMVAQFPEFTRKGRFDEIFWVPLPNDIARREIFEIYLRPLLEDSLMLSPDLFSYEALDGLPEPIRLGLTGAIQRNAGTGSSPEIMLKTLCEILGQPGVSVNMTGAEIESAVNEALYRAYSDARQSGAVRGLTPRLLVQTVLDAQTRALYGPGGGGAAGLGALEAAATNNRWPFAG